MTTGNAKSKRRAISHLGKLFVLLVFAMPACDGFVCSRTKIEAMELANAGVEDFRNGLQDSAARKLKQAIAKDPSYVLAYYNLGKVYQKQRKWEKAIEQFEAASQKDPSNANYFYDLGESNLEAKRLEDAEHALKKASDLDAKLFKAHWRLGLVYLQLEKPKEADLALRKAIEINARLDKPFVALGHLYLDYYHSQEAEQVFSECVRINRGSAECFNGHGLALKEQKKFDTAAGEFKRALQLDSALTTGLYNLGMTYAEWFDAGNDTAHKELANEYLKKFVKRAGSKTGGGIGYVKAANDKLYALSGG